MRRSGSILDETELAAGNLGERRRRRGARELRSRKPQRRWWWRGGEWRCAGAGQGSGARVLFYHAFSFGAKDGHRWGN